ncbi:MAG: hypothetical protein ACR2GN_05815 [Bacteroidia bacterium]
MQHTKIAITKEELSLMQNIDFLLTKATVMKKMKLLLQQLQDEIGKAATGYNLLPNLFAVHGKISNGENYRGLPFLILDYPRVFGKEDVFAFRSMFWWGNYFLFTLHLQGKYLQMYKSVLIDNLKQEEISDIYISTGDNPWQHHLEDNNFSLYSNEILLPANPEFLKITRKLKLDEWQKLPEYGRESFVLFIRLLGADSLF